MWTWFASTLQKNVELAIFLSLAIGYFIGPKKLFGFSLGNVTATLLAGILVGQLGITISPPLKSFSFLLFIFAVGYKVGPQFFAGLKKDGLRQIGLGLFYAVLGLAATVMFARVAGFNVGEAAGLLGGALTQSTTIGTASDAIGRLGVNAAVTKTLQNDIAVGFAVSYVVGTIVAVITCSRIVPRLLRINLAEECKKLADEMGLHPGRPEGFFDAYHVNSIRAIRVAPNGISGKTVGDIEDKFAQAGQRVFVAAIHHGDAISAAARSDIVAEGDVIALAGPSSTVIAQSAGTEIDDGALLGKLTIEQLDVVATSPRLQRHTVEEVLAAPNARGVVLKKITRAGIDIPVLPQTIVQRGDTLRLVGFQSAVETAANVVGYPMRPSPTADIVFIGIGIVIGGLIGVLSFKGGGIPFALGTGCGALITGIIAGYFRARSPTFGNVSAGAQWVFDSFALTVFIAVIGLDAGPGFVGGVKAMGVPLIVGGALIPLVCIVVSAFFGRYVLKIHNVELCGALAGADTSAAALGAVQDVAKSNLVTLGYTISYAVGNIVLTIWGAVIVAIFATQTAI